MDASELEIDVSALGTPSANTRRRVKGEQFYRGPGLKEIARYGGYSVYTPAGNTDPYVRETLKLYDRDMYEEIRGFTRRPAGTDGMYKALFKYDRKILRLNDLPKHKQRFLTEAISETRARFRLPHKVQPLDMKNVAAEMRMDTAAGVSFPGRKKGEVLSEIYEKGRWLQHRCKQPDNEGKFDPRRVQFPPCQAGQRGHMSPADDPKTRLTWIYPAEMLAIEGKFAPVLIKGFADQPDNPMLTGKSAQRMYTEWLVNYRTGENLVGLDESSFDTSPWPLLIHAAFDCLRQNFDFEHFGVQPVSRKEKKKWAHVWEAMVWYFINTPILMPDGRMFRKFQGVPSGSWFTQLIDSTVNYIFILYLTKCQSHKILDLRVLGDDSAFRCTSLFDLNVASRDADQVGFVLNPEKCEISQDPNDFKLLGTKYKFGFPYRPTIDWFKFLLYPENVPIDVAQSMTRFVGLWLCGAMNDPSFCKYFEFYQSCYECPTEGFFSKDQRKWMEIVYGKRAPRGWKAKDSLFWRSIFYIMG